MLISLNFEKQRKATETSLVHQKTIIGEKLTVNNNSIKTLKRFLINRHKSFLIEQPIYYSMQFSLDRYCVQPTARSLDLLLTIIFN